MWTKLLYFICCIFQPICLPVPEMATVLWGSYTIGSKASFTLGVLGTIIGIAIMYSISNKCSQKIIVRFHCEKKVGKFQHYVERYKVMIIGFFFIVPVLPDEIICIGAPLVGIGKGTFLALGFISKCVSVGMAAFTKEIASVCSLSSMDIIMCELIILFVFAYIFKRKNQRMDKNQYSDIDSSGRFS